MSLKIRKKTKEKRDVAAGCTLVAYSASADSLLAQTLLSHPAKAPQSASAATNRTIPVRRNYIHTRPLDGVLFENQKANRLQHHLESSQIAAVNMGIYHNLIPQSAEI